MTLTTPAPNIYPHRDRPDWPWKGPCFIRVYFSTTPQDLVRWSVAAATLARTGSPVPERTLRRKYLAYGGRVWMAYDPMKRRDVEHVSMDRIRMFHRDLVNGWLRPLPKKRRSR